MLKFFRRNIHKNNSDNSLSTEPTFNIKNLGRCGIITCNYQNKIFEFEYEMSGSSHYDIIMTPIDLKMLNNQNTVTINEDSKSEILNHLRVWLKSKRIRSDIDLPNKIEFENELCICSECNNNRIKESAYCLRHYDKNLFR